MRVVVSGGTGALGRVLVAALASRGHDVVVLTRNKARAAGFSMLPRVFLEEWDVRKGGAWQTVVNRADVVAHLAAPPFVDGPHAPAEQKALAAERLRAMQEMVRAIQQAPAKPKVLFVASSVAVYGDHTEVVDEHTPTQAGAGWIAEMFRAVEDAASTLRPQLRVVPLRFGQLLGPHSPVLAVKSAAALPPPARVPFSFVHVNDAASLIVRALTSDLDRPLNVVAPHTTLLMLHQALRLPAAPARSGLARLFGKGNDDVAKVTVLAGQAARSMFAQSLGFSASFDTLDSIVRASRAVR